MATFNDSAVSGIGLVGGPGYAQQVAAPTQSPQGISQTFIPPTQPINR